MKPPPQVSIIYAIEADVLNMALFGMTAAAWRDANPDLKGNIRDCATINELICLSNMENINAVLINEGLPQRERLKKLNQIAIQQMSVLQESGKPETATLKCRVMLLLLTAFYSPDILSAKRQLHVK